MNVFDRLVEFASNQAALLTLVASALALLATGVMILVLVRMRLYSGPYAKLRKQIKRAGLEEALHLQLKGVEENRETIEGLREDLQRLRIEGLKCTQAVGLVRYDAFDEVGGMQSFSLCLLDAHRNGVILSHITGKNSTRAYARQVEDGSAGARIGEEEQGALDQALTSLDSPSEAPAERLLVS